MAHINQVATDTVLTSISAATGQSWAAMASLYVNQSTAARKHINNAFKIGFGKG